MSGMWNNDYPSRIMTRWSKRFFGVIWLFMLALLVAMWVRSYWLDDLWAFSSPQNYSRVQSSGGEIGYTWATSILWSSDPATRGWSRLGFGVILDRIIFPEPSYH